MAAKQPPKNVKVLAILRLRLCRVCYAECYNKNGIDVEEKCKVCKMIRNSVEENLKLYHEVLEKNPSKLAKLNELIMA